MVYLPPDYDQSEMVYPAVYVLHWFEGDYQTFAWSMSAEFDQLVRDGILPPMILVFPDGGNKLGGSSFMSSPAVGDYETYLMEEIVGRVESTYRAIPDPSSRGITGCSMGGIASLYLGLRHPGVFGVAAPMSGLYEWETRPQWQSADDIALLGHDPRSLDEFARLSLDTRFMIALAAVAAPNDIRPPFFADLPYRFDHDSNRVVIEEDVMARIVALGPSESLRLYLSQPQRLKALLIYTDTGSYGGSENQDLLATRRFHEGLTQAGVEHEYAEINAPHCDFPFAPVLQFLGANLAR